MKFIYSWETIRAFEHKIETRGKTWEKSSSSSGCHNGCLIMTMSTMLGSDKLQSRATLLLPGSTINALRKHTLYNLSLTVDTAQK